CRASTGRGTARSARARRRTPSCGRPPAGRSPRSPRRWSRGLSSDRLEVDLLERRGQNARLVDALACADELFDDPGHVLTRARNDPAAAIGLELDPPRLGELPRRACSDDLAGKEDDDPVADQ